MEHQVDDLIGEIRSTTEKGYRTLVTTLTKRMAERLTDYLDDLDIRVRYMHSDVETMERQEIIRDLRLGEFDVLVGINLLREGLDLPEVGLVAILDADKEGYLRSTTSLIQTVGRAARNVDGRVIMYADRITDSMAKTIEETNRRRALQMAYNEEHGIIPQSVQKSVRDLLEISKSGRDTEGKALPKLTQEQKEMRILLMEQEMRMAAAELDFERAAKLRDGIIALREGKEGEPASKKVGQTAQRRQTPVNDRIVIRGAKQHNLKNVDITLPRDQLIVFTGLSGSGKSSLAFDTIYAEGQRRYVESLSSYARQFLGQMDKPEVDSIDGLSPAISIDQKPPAATPDPPWAPLLKFTIICGCCTPTLVSPIAPSAASPSFSRAWIRWWTPFLAWERENAFGYGAGGSRPERGSTPGF